MCDPCQRGAWSIGLLKICAGLTLCVYLVCGPEFTEGELWRFNDGNSSQCINQLLRPEFPASRDHEHETLHLVKGVAETFDQSSAGPSHTPSLYSLFLRALLAAKTEPPSEAASDFGDNEAVAQMNGNPDQRQVSNTEPYQLLSEFHFASEMGPVADMSTFPPTMANAQPDDLGMLSMNSILSGGFWDNVLVPGEFVDNVQSEIRY